MCVNVLCVFINDVDLLCTFQSKINTVTCINSNILIQLPKMITIHTDYYRHCNNRYVVVRYTELCDVELIQVSPVLYNVQ